LSHHEEALHFLLEAEPHLSEADKMRCGADTIIALTRASQTSQAQQKLLEYQKRYETQKTEKSFVVWDFLELCIKQRARENAFYLANYEAHTERLRLAGYKDLSVIAMSMAVTSHRAMGQYKQAIRIAHQTLPVAHALGLTYRQAHLLNSLADYYYSQGALKKAWILANKAEKLCKKTGGQLLLADILTTKGCINQAKGLHDEAIADYKQSGDIYLRHAFLLGFTNNLINVGLVQHARGELQAAGASFMQAEAKATEYGFLGMAGNANLRMGAIQTLMGNYSQAEKLFLNAFDMAQEEALTQATSASFATIVCPPERYESTLAMALAAVEKCEMTIHLAVARRVLGESMIRHGRVEEGRAHILEAEQFTRNMPEQWAISAIRLAECDVSLFAQAKPITPPTGLRQLLAKIKRRSQKVPEVLTRAELALADLAQAQGQTRRAMRHIHQSLASIRVLRLSGDDPVLASQVASTFDEVYWRGARLAHQLNDGETLLSFAEHRRAQWLTRALNAHAPGAAPLPELDELGRTLRQLRAQTANPANRASPEQMAAYRAGMAEVKRRYDELDTQLIFSGAGSQALRKTTPVAGVMALRSAFNQRFGQNWAAITLEPLNADGSAWLRLRLTPNSFEHVALPASIVIRQLLKTISQSSPTERRRMAAWENMWQPLADWLRVDEWLPPGATAAHPIPLLVADAGWLARVPLGILPLADGTPLGHKAAFRFMPALNAALPGLLRQGSPGQLRALVVAPGQFGGWLADLPSTQTEGDLVKALWPNSVVLAGAEASLANVRKLAASGELGQFDVIHFATHAVSEQNQLRMGGLALSDGPLTIQEMLTWTLNARLVALGACDSAFHVSFGGEERLGMEVALMSVGAGAVLASRWPVKDAPASRMIEVFLRHYAQTPDAPLALIHAEKALANELPLPDVTAWRVVGMR
jgi:tetratricopeptide (TPR) repeat protein